MEASEIPESAPEDRSRLSPVDCTSLGALVEAIQASNGVQMIGG